MEYSWDCTCSNDHFITSFCLDFVLRTTRACQRYKSIIVCARPVLKMVSKWFRKKQPIIVQRTDTVGWSSESGTFVSCLQTIKSVSQFLVGTTTTIAIQIEQWTVEGTMQCRNSILSHYKRLKSAVLFYSLAVEFAHVSLVRALLVFDADTRYELCPYLSKQLQWFTNKILICPQSGQQRRTDPIQIVTQNDAGVWFDRRHRLGSHPQRYTFWMRYQNLIRLISLSPPVYANNGVIMWSDSF